jgi:hypothetical protein
MGRVAAAAVVALVLASSAGAGARTVQFQVFASTGIPLTDIVWTGTQFLYLENTTNQIWAAPPKGTPLRHFAGMPKQVEETRCRIPPAGSGFVPRDVYCHSPSNVIYRISSDGKRVATLARLPNPTISDGALAFDTVGKFGHVLLAVTGRSGDKTKHGGTAYAVSPKGKVHRIGSYGNTGGGDEAMVAPASFGSAAGDLLVTVDAGRTGSLVAIDPKGHARTLLSFPDGLNPIVTVGKGTRPAVPGGLYVTDTTSKNVFFAPAAQIGAGPGTVIVGSELQGRFWIVKPAGRGYTASELRTSLAGGKYNFEGAVFVP